MSEGAGMALSRQRLTTENEPGGEQENNGVSRRVKRCSGENQPVYRFPIMNDQVSDVKQLQVWNQEIDAVHHGTHRVRHLKGDLVQVSSEQ